MAMQWAWQAVRAGGPYADSTLDIKDLPWSLRCEACGHKWESETLDEQCACTSEDVRIVGGDQLQLVSLDVIPTEDYAVSGFQDAP
jgi:Zn finger protein HypA/HybF involved in hydrogenase expression